jgi:hypothetical protein
LFTNFIDEKASIESMSERWFNLICAAIVFFSLAVNPARSQNVSEEQVIKDFVSLLPASDLVYYVNVRRLFGEALPRFIPEPLLPQIKSVFAQVQQKMAVDLSAITYQASATRFVIAASGKTEIQEVTLIRSASGAEALLNVLRSQLKGKDRQEQYKSTTIYIFRPEDLIAAIKQNVLKGQPGATDKNDLTSLHKTDTPLPDAAFALLDSNTVATGAVASVRAVIDAKNGQGAIESSLVNRLLSNKNTLMSVAGKIPPGLTKELELSEVKHGSEIGQQLASVSSLYLSLAMSPEAFTFFVSLQMQSPEQAQKLSELLNITTDDLIRKIDHRIFRDLFASRKIASASSEVTIQLDIAQEKSAAILKPFTTEPAAITAMRGEKLSFEEAEKLESKLRENPNDLTTRTILLGYYQRKHDESSEKQRQRHALWIIENRPEAEIAGDPTSQMFFHYDEGFYNRAKQLWLKQAEAHKKEPAVLANAAEFFLRVESDIAEGLFKQLQVLEPDNYKWPERLGYLYSLDLNETIGDGRKKRAARSLEYYEKALSLAEGDYDRRFLLDDVVNVAFEAGDLVKAKMYATELLEKYGRDEKDSIYGRAVFEANQVLGRVALREGNLAKAKIHLIESAKTPGDPALRTFGPSMTLARELLQKGEKEAVIEYLHLCAKFWEHKGERLQQWELIIRKGGTPDFGNQ